MSNRTFWAIGGLVVLILVVGVAIVITSSVGSASAREYVIEIPEGTGELIDAGQDPDIIPQEIHLTLGEQDILVIRNNDVVGHRISDFWVGAGETFRQEFRTAAIYQGECTIHESAQIQIIVDES